MISNNRGKQSNEPITTGKQIHVISVKRGKTRSCKSRLGLVLLLIGWESGLSFFNQLESEVKQKQSKHNITFDTSLKTALTTRILITKEAPTLN